MAVLTLQSEGDHGFWAQPRSWLRGNPWQCDFNLKSQISMPGTQAARALESSCAGHLPGQARTARPGRAAAPADTAHPEALEVRFTYSAPLSTEPTGTPVQPRNASAAGTEAEAAPSASTGPTAGRVVLPCSQLPAPDPWGHMLSRLTESKWPGISLRDSPSTARASLPEGATQEQPWLSAAQGCCCGP